MIVIGVTGHGEERHKKGNEPAHQGPAKKDVQQQDSRGVVRVPHGGNDGGEKLEDAEEAEEVHRSPHNGSRIDTHSVTPEFTVSLRFSVKFNADSEENGSLQPRERREFARKFLIAPP